MTPDTLTYMNTITTAEAAALLGIKPRTVLWDLYHYDDFPRPSRDPLMPSRHRWDPKAILAWRAEHESK
jgi:predicted DNA-binding transcriptional regulator AlpA